MHITQHIMKTPISILLILFILPNLVYAQQRFAVANGNWNSTATWSTSSGGAPGASVPVAGDAVTIERNFTVNITADAACASLQLAGTATNNGGLITFAAGTITLAVSGNIQLGNSGNNQRDGTITFQSGSIVSAGSIGLGGTGGGAGQGIINMTAGGTLSVSGAITVNAGSGTWTPGTGLVQLSGTTTLNAPFTSFNNLTINGGTTTLGAGIALTGDFTNNGGTFTPGANTVTFNGTGAQAINGTASTQTFNNIVVNKASGALSVSGSTTTLNTAAFTLTLGIFNAPPTMSTTGTVTLTAGTFTAGANLNIGGTTTNFTNNGATFTPGSGTVTFTGSGNQAINGTSPILNYNDLTINKSGGALSVGASPLNVVNLTRTAGTFTAPATVNVSGNMLLTAGTYTAGANTNIGGDFTNNGGTFTPGTNTVTFNGTGAQEINGTVATQTFGNVIVNKSGGTLSVGGSTTTLNVAAFTQTLGDFTAPATLSTTGTVTLTAGTFTAGANLNIGGTTTNFTNNGATFTPGSGTVTFTGSGNQAINGISPILNYNNLTINKSGGTLSVGASPLNVVNLTRTAGTFTAPFTVNVSGNVLLTAGTYTAGANTNIGGDFTNNGGTFTPGTNTVTFNGTGAQAINGTLTPQPFNNIIINKPSGALSVTGAITLNVAGNWTNNNSAFVPGSSTVTFNGTTGPQQINGTAVTQTFNNLTVNKSGTAPLTLSVSGSTTTINVAALTQTAGNFTAPATLNATGVLTLTAGTFTAGANTNLEGDFVNNGGTFTAGTNTVTFGGAGVKTISGSAATLATFHNVIITSGSVLFGNVSATRALNISNNLTINGGSFSSGNTGAGAYTINLTGNLQNDGTIDFSANSATGHIFSLQGASKTISGGGTTTFQSLQKNTTALTNVNLNKSIRVNGALTWSTDGLFILSSSDFTFGNIATVTGSGAARYIQSDGTSSLTGQVVKVNNNTTATWQFLFPIGTTTNGYSPLDMTAASGAAVNTAPTLNSTLSVKAITSPDETGKLKRTFRMTVAGNAAATTFTGARFNYFNPGDVSGLEPIASYTTLWYQRESTGIWTAISGTAPGATFFTGPTVIPQPLSNDTYYFTIGTPGAYGQTWYSYQSGNWNDPLSWTTDGSLFPLYVNPAPAKVPGAGDNVVITSGKTITMNINNVVTNSINVIGNLDLAATTGHTFNTISGAGIIKIAGASDNFPAGNATNFVDNAVGGTVEINGTGMLLNGARTYNNVVINMSGTSNVAVLKSNYTINGDFTITRGLLQFENATPANRTLIVNGHVSVAANGGIRTFGANNRHEFNLFGDFVNNGTAYFTNRIAPDYGIEATDGIVDVNLLSGSRDQAVTCNGETRFYRIEINKGTDDTYKASITASSSANFNLFGRANVNIDAASGTNDNALGLIAGTVEIGANVTIAQLNTATLNYSIYERAQLWVNGGSVSKIGDASGNGAIVPYGKVRVSAGSLTSDVGSGLTLRDDGIVQVEGGTLTSRVIRTSVLGVGAVGTYLQSGGDVILTGTTTGAIANTYAVFSLTYPGNVFNMSGGTLTVRSGPSTTDRGAVFINSDPGNVSVTGGTVILEINNNNAYRVTSRAPFWNVILRKTGGTNSTVQLLGTLSGTGAAPATQTLAIQPLVVQNDFSIESPVIFLTNNADVTVGGNFEIQNGATYTHGTNTTTINGGGVGSLIFGNLGATQTFNNLTINKTNATDEVVITTGRPSPSSAIQVNGTFTLTKGIFDYGSFVTSARGTVTLAAGITLGKSTSTGKLLMNGTVDQTINSSDARVYNLELNNTDATPVVSLATDNLTILGTLTMTAGIFDINTLKLTLSGASANIAGTGFGLTKMIQTAANNSDGGLELYLDANEALTYPIGVAGKYTPVTAAFTSFADDGMVNIIPTNGVLQTTNLAGGTSILGYYWKVKHAGFSVLPTVSYQFTYVSGDVAGTEALYVPGKVLDEVPFTRSSENDVAKVDDATNIITFNGAGSGFTLELANYTAGEPNRFTGAPEVYYTRVFGDGNGRAWTTASNWTLGTNGALAKHDSGQPAAPTFPQAGDIAIVGYVPWTESILPVADRGKPHGIAINGGVTVNVAELRFEQMKDASNNPTARNYAYNFQFRPTVVINNNGTQGQLTNAKVSGEGMFWIRTATGGNPLSDPTFAGVDLGAFNQQDSSYVVYENAINGATYLNMPATFPNLMMATNGWGNQNHDTTIPNNITVNGDLELLGNVNLVLATGATGDITVRRNLRFFRSVAINDSGEGSELRFGNTGTPRTVTVFGNLLLGNQVSGQNTAAVIRVLTPGATPITHTFNLHGNFIQRTRTAGNGFKAGTSSTQDRIHVNLLGATSMTLTNNGGDAPQFYSLTVNKGTSISTTAQFNSPFTIDGPTDQATKSLVLQNGLFVINSASTITLTSGGGDFSIPGTAGLEVRAGTAQATTTSAGANILLDGLLRVSGGAVNIVGSAGTTDTNYIEYSNSGNATIEVTGGSLTVAGQVRRDLTSSTGVLKYTQSAGTVLIGNEATSTPLRGVFEVLNAGSQFNHSGGSFTIVRGNGSTSVPSLWLEPGSSSITTNSTITIGNTITPAGTIGIQSTAILNNLTIAGLAANAPVVSMYVTPLTVNGVLSVATGNTLNALGRDLTIGGDFTVNGTYTSGNNTTTFTNTGTSTIGGDVSTLSFHNFTKTGAGTLNLSRNIAINRDLILSTGTLSTASFGIFLRRHAVIDATMTSASGIGLAFSSTVQQQQLKRSVSGTGTLGIVTINNANGVIIPDGNGYDFNITNNLRMQSGILDIGGSLLSLGVSALITPVSPYSAANLIQTNSSFTDKGVRKQFPTNYTTDFIFPVGQSNYTPVTFNFSSGTTGSSGTPTITVRPSNRVHPVIVDDAVGEPPVINDLNNVLQYYWIINATNVSSTFSSTMSLQYVQPLVAVTSPYSESNYIAARILTDPLANPSLNIQKFSDVEVNETTNVISFSFTSVTDQRNISGDYFAGVDQAIPNNVPTYTTLGGGAGTGNVGDNIYTTPVLGGINGTRIIVSAGDEVTFNTGSVILYQTVVNAGAKIVFPSGSIGNSLGILTGTGDLEINSNTGSAVLPAADYETFFSCSGGGLIFGGSGSYEILGGITQLRNLTLNGVGDKSLANNNLTICNNLTINEGSFFNSLNRTITVQNDVLMNGGTFNNSAGTLTISRDFVQTLGTFEGGTGGTKTISRNLIVNGGVFNPGSGASNVIRVNGDMTVSGSATINSGTGQQRFNFQGSTPQLLTGNFTGTRAFDWFQINNPAGLTLVGNTTIKGRLLLTNGLITPGSSVFLIDLLTLIVPAEGSSSSFVNGKLYKSLAAGQGFVFPIGKGTRWRNGSVIATNLAATWDFEYFAGPATGVVASAPAPRSNPVSNFTSSDPAILRMSGGEYWRVSDGTSTSSGRSARVGLSWGIESDVSSTFAERESMSVMSWNGSNWTNHGGINFSGGHTQSRGTFESSSLGPFLPLSFSENIVIIGSTEVANPLPVVLLSFSGKHENGFNKIKWVTASELNNDFFELERSANGEEFRSIGRIQGKGTTNELSTYLFDDEAPLVGNNYYRLKQVDFNGAFEYSNIILVKNNSEGSVFNLSVFPNPVSTAGELTIRSMKDNELEATVTVRDITGKVITFYSTVETLTEKTLSTSTWSGTGVYIVEMKQGEKRVFRRVIVD